MDQLMPSRAEVAQRQSQREHLRHVCHHVIPSSSSSTAVLGTACDDDTPTGAITIVGIGGADGRGPAALAITAGAPLPLDGPGGTDDDDDAAAR